MKALSASILTLVMAAAPIVCSPAGNDKILQNKGGTVTYGPSATPTTPLANRGSIALNDNDYAKTGGGNSLATITLPDSSVVVMGENSSVQMQSFDNKTIATAKFVIVGKIRFTVNHPQGAQANYTFQTATGQIAVRGTIGDIFAQPGGGLQVNVYALSSPTLPVQVTLVNGQVFTLAAGQSLVATAAAGAITAGVTGVTQSTFAPFSQLGAPANAGSLGIQGAASATSATGAVSTTAATTATATGAATAATTTAVAAGAVGTAAAATVITNNNTATASPSPSPTPTATPTTAPTATPTIAPTATPSSTSVPIVIQNRPTVPGVPHGTIPHPGGRPSPHP